MKFFAALWTIATRVAISGPTVSIVPLRQRFQFVLVIITTINSMLRFRLRLVLFHIFKDAQARTL